MRSPLHRYGGLTARARWSTRGFFRRFTPMVLAMIGVNTAIHVVLLNLPGDTQASVLMHLGLSERAVADYRFYTLFTYMFLHSPRDILHILFNMFLLYSLGPWVEKGLGKFRFMTLYFGSGLMGGVFFLGKSLLFGQDVAVAIGASAAVLGVIAAFSMMFPDARLLLWFVAPLRAGSLIWLAIVVDSVVALLGANIAFSAHLGGMFFAYLYLRRPWRKEYRIRASWRIQKLLRRR